MASDTNRLLFGLACLLPAALIVTAAFFGSFWLWAALASITVCVVIMDRAGPQFEAPASSAQILPLAVGLAHFAALTTVLWALGQTGELRVGEKVLLVITMGLFAGQVSNACAHELIHRADRASRRLGTAIYCSILNGHHVSAHLLVHHVHAGTDKDPNSAPLGQGFYRYYLKTSIAEYRAGFKAEAKRIGGKARLRHPYLLYSAGSAVMLLLAWLIGGGLAVVGLLAISLHAQAQLLLSDYLQHYGLSRQLDEAGKPEPMGPQHSWNAPQSYSSALMMNAPRHSDHHMNPARDFTQLRLTTEMPTLPRSVPVMGAIALVPPLWRRMMDVRARKWSHDGAVRDPNQTKPSTIPTSQAIPQGR